MRSFSYLLNKQNLGQSSPKKLILTLLCFFIFYLHTEAQVFCRLTGNANPYNSITVDAGAFPCLADIDADGDLDLFVGDASFDPLGLAGRIRYFENIGTSTTSNFVELQHSDGPVSHARSNYTAGPIITLADIDADNDLDLFVAEFPRDIEYHENIGTPTDPSFIVRSGSSNPLGHIDDRFTGISFVDIDNDRDLDMFMGTDGGTTTLLGIILFYENIGTSESPNYVQRTGADNPLYDFRDQAFRGLITMDFSDMDCDGDFDVMTGEIDGLSAPFENIGTKNKPVFIPYVNAPFDGLDLGDGTTPSFADMDNDGDEDLCIGDYDGFLHYFENKTPITFSDFQIKVFLEGAYNGSDMNTDLKVANLLSLEDPYGLGESVSVIPPDVVDWVHVELRSPTDNTGIVTERACFIRKDGQLIDLDGSIDIKFKNLGVTEAYVVVRHRNHLGIMTNMPVTIN